MPPKKNVECNGCGGKHQRPINSRCAFRQQQSDGAAAAPVDAVQPDVGKQILSTLQQLSDRISSVEVKVQQQDGAGRSPTTSHSPISAKSHASHSTSTRRSEGIIPTLASLRSTGVQEQVEDRIRELHNFQGKYKSQRGGSEVVYCKSQVPWPQNYILGGNSKTRVSYDSLSMSQWVAGFSSIVREETDPEIRNAMLEYLTDLMEDSHDFGWLSAKASHAVLLCRMEEQKVNWLDVEKN